MKAGVWMTLIAGLVSVQAVLLPYATVWGVMPDIGLIVVCLVGLFEGELEGLLLGLALGWIMSLFSAADLATCMITKGAVGYVAGLAGRHVVYLAPAVLLLGILAASCASGLLTAALLNLSNQQDWWWAVRTVVVPQAVIDAMVGGALYWLVWSRLNIQRWVSEYRT
jgi:hypothetical protein